MGAMDDDGRQRDYYEVLGVARGAAAREIRRAFRGRAIRYHPDNNRDDPAEAHRRFQEVLEAFEVLSDEFSRRYYDHPQRAVGRGHPAAAAGAAMILAVATVPLAAIWQAAGLACGVACLTVATRALCSAGTGALSLGATRVAELARLVAVVGLSVAAVGLTMRAGGLVAGHLAADPMWTADEFLQSAWGAVTWIALAGVLSLWVGASRARLSRERQRWGEYRFLAMVMGAGLVYGVIVDQAAAWLAPAYFQQEALGVNGWSADVAVDTAAARWAALGSGVESLWTIGLSMGLAVLLANSPERSLPRLSYRGMFRRIAPAWGCVLALAAAGALAGWAGDWGGLLRGGLVLRLQDSPAARAVQGRRVGELLGVLAGVGAIVHRVHAARKKQARRIRLTKISRVQPILPHGPDRTP